MPEPAESKDSSAEIGRRWLATPDALHRVAGVAPRELDLGEAEHRQLATQLPGAIAQRASTPRRA